MGISQPVALGAYRLLALLAGAVVADGFEGWSFRGGRLYAPEDDRRGWSAAELRAVHFERQLVAALRARDRRGRLARPALELVKA